MTELETLVTLNHGNPPAMEWSAWEPLFLDSGAFALSPALPDVSVSQCYLDFLAHRISRNPKELVSHVRRILLALSCSDRDATFAGLRDLTIALDGLGQELRLGLLGKCRALLTPEQILMLLDGRGNLSKFQPEFVDLVTQDSTRAVAASSNVLDEARECLDNGQVDVAQSILEQALADTPNDLELTNLLHEIYRRAHIREAAISMYSRLGSLDDEVKRLWEDLFGHFEGGT
jgi:hypothetical protein